MCIYIMLITVVNPPASNTSRCDHDITNVTAATRQVLESWDLEVAPAHPWTVALLLSSQQAAGRPVGMIMDLSNHDTLYADEIPPYIAYRHVKLVAKVCSMTHSRFFHCYRGALSTSLAYLSTSPLACPPTH